MKTVSISGFGGGYENVCQQMLKNGREWIEANPDKAKQLKGSYKSYHNVTGICIAETELAKQFDKEIMKGIDDATGAMHHAAVEHLLFIADNGLDKYFDEFMDMPERIFEWDGTEQSIPKAELLEGRV